ncbi:MAG: Gfo/Idh/MocA family oxidoreductase [Pseudogulbenkiania sp.]|nr:Gfo/Idh/MocA family oxidoreductase [Pseudogulbenkiania sp.]
MNVCMIGHGMMGVWHSEGLAGADCRLYSVVGRRPEPTREFAEKYGYRKWTTSLDEALSDPAVDIVIVAGPSETHAEMATAALEHGKHTLVEIPIAMNLADSERVVALAKEKGLTLGVVHPMRYRAERAEVLARIQAGEENVRHTHGRFFINRLQNIGATGYHRSWTDNILWHHSTHLVDLGLWMACGGDMRQADELVGKVSAFMPALDERTGIPMEIVLLAETRNNQSIVVTGSYYGRERIYDTLVVTDRNSYRLDENRATLTTGDAVQNILSERENAWLAARDFVKAVWENRDPLVPGWSVLPTMRILHRAQEQWDAVYGKQVLPGRPVI